MPVPRQLSSNCGVCARIAYEGSWEKLVDDEIEKMYLILPDGYQPVFTSES